MQPVVKRNLPSSPYGGFESESEDQYYRIQSYFGAPSEDEVGQAWYVRTSYEAVVHNTFCNAAAFWQAITQFELSIEL